MNVKRKGSVSVMTDATKYTERLVTMIECPTCHNPIRASRPHDCKKDVIHNQCDICFKLFSTAIGFHRHYPQCVQKEIDRNNQPSREA